MATITPSLDLVGNSVIATWSGMADGDTAVAVDVSGFSFRGLQFIGTASGSTFDVKGSLDNSSFGTIGGTTTGFNPEMHNVSRGVAFNARYVRPEISGGGATGITVILSLSN